MILVLLLLGFSLVAGFIVELYKKYIRKGKSATWENRIIAAVLSVGFGSLSYFSINLVGLPEILKHSPILIAVFSIFIYFAQFDACMEVWKPLVKKWLTSKT